jgi:hypothetical protein
MSPELDRISVYGCSSVFYWELEVQGSSGKYIVRWSKEHKASDRFKLGYSCSCPAYKYQAGECKHIKRVRRENRRCGWSQEIDGGEPDRLENGKLQCPGCGDSVIAYEIAV